MKRTAVITIVTAFMLANCSQPRSMVQDKQVGEQDSVAKEKLLQPNVSEGATVDLHMENPTTSFVTKERDSVEVLFGYLKVYPKELGIFSTEPLSIINQINTQIQYGYNNWRIPTDEELTLLRNSGYIGTESYMTRENGHGIVLLVTDGKDYFTLQDEEKAKNNGISANSQEWMDLGLRSGTLWKTQNEYGFYTFDQAVEKYGNRLPSYEQLAELVLECKWEWQGNGYKVIGPNGNHIILSALGYHYCDGDIYGVGSDGSYWSSTPEVTVNAMRLFFNRYGKGLGYNYQCRGRSVRLVNDNHANNKK